MITHDEARELVDRIYIHTDWETKEKLLDYISQQEKVTKLLGLYQKKSELLVQIANGKYLQDDYMKLLEKIDNLEKELGEIK